ILPTGFVAPCLPTKTDNLPAGSGWLHEIKHDGFRVIARKTGAQVRLYSRPGNDLTYRFPLIVETLARLRSRSCITDGEAVACDDNGVTLFNRVRYRRHDESIFLYAFDLIELNGDDLRRDPLEGRNGFKSVKSAPSRRCCECATRVACQVPEASGQLDRRSVRAPSGQCDSPADQAAHHEAYERPPAP